MQLENSRLEAELDSIRQKGMEREIQMKGMEREIETLSSAMEIMGAELAQLRATAFSVQDEIDTATTKTDAERAHARAERVMAR